MKKIAATKAKEKFGELLDNAQKSPVTIEKKGEPVAVVLSMEDYQTLNDSAEDSYWIAQAEAAKKGGYVGANESEKFLTKLLNA